MKGGEPGTKHRGATTGRGRAPDVSHEVVNEEGNNYETRLTLVRVVDHRKENSQAVAHLTERHG